MLAEVENKEKKEKDVSTVTNETKKRGSLFNLFEGKMQYRETDQGFQELLYFPLFVMIKLKIYFSSDDQFWLDYANTQYHALR